MFYKEITFCWILIVFIDLCLAITPEVNTTSGVVSGTTVRVLNTDINQYYNIPFAEPPVGALRFAKPVPLKKAREDVIDGTKFTSNGCDSTTEDCLVLNVFAPEFNDTNAPLKPVMFWIYGGAFTGGSIRTYDGSALAAHDIVFVAPNYRLGPFGFLYGGEESAPGNVGLYDQTLALKWVRDNIHLFGGDKDMITIFGESAGAESVSAHIYSPISKGLYKRAIMESGTQLLNIKRYINKESRLNNTKDAAKKLNCTGDEWIDCLRKLDARLIKSMNLQYQGPQEGTEFLPLVAQEAFKTGNFAQDIDVIAGNNQNEGGFDGVNLRLTRETFETTLVKKFNGSFPDATPEQRQAMLDFYLSTADKNSSDSLARTYADYSGDEYLGCVTYSFAKQFALNAPKSNVFYYQLNYNGLTLNRGCNSSTMGVCHGSDVPFVFGYPILRPNTSIQLEYDFSIEVMKMWTDFAKTGKPTADSHKWPQLLNGSQTPKVKELNAFNYYRVYDDLYHYTCDGLFKDLFGN